MRINKGIVLLSRFVVINLLKVSGKSFGGVEGEEIYDKIYCMKF